MGMLIYINGAPGVGKLTIAQNMAQRLSARILDNHAIYNVGFALTDFRSTAFYEAVRAVRDVAYDQILRLADHEVVILTAADFTDSDWGIENWQAVQQLAKHRKWPFFVISLICDEAEHRHRIVTEERERRGKLRDVGAVTTLSRRPIIRGEGNRSIELDVTSLAAEDASSRLTDWITIHF